MHRRDPSSRRRLAFALALAAVATACAALVGVEEPTLGDPQGVEEGEPPRPKGDSACSVDPDTCPLGSYCMPEEKTCAVGCGDDEACRAFAPESAPYCNVDRRQCVACLEDEHCAGDNVECTAGGQCAERCTEGGGACSDPSKTCCKGLCVDLTSDPSACGDCSNDCPGDDRQCCTATCSQRWSDPQNCGGCGTDCRGALKNVVAPACELGRCGYTQCADWFADLDKDRANGCEATCGDKRGPCCEAPLAACKEQLYCASGTCKDCKKKHASCGSDAECCSGTCKTNKKCA